LVVGAGPVGLFTALLVAERGRRVDIIDSEWRTAAHSYALALHPGTLKLLEEVGVASDVVARGNRISKIAFYEGSSRRAEMRLSDLPGDHRFALVLPQSKLEGLLEQRLKSRKIRVSWNHRLARLETTPDGAVAEVEKLGKQSMGYPIAHTEWAVEKRIPVRAAFVVGADGFRSTVRKQLGIAFEPSGDPQLFEVFEFESDADVSDEIRVVLGPDATNALWPLPGKRFRWSFELRDAGDHREPRAKQRLALHLGDQAYPQLTEERLLTLIRDRAPWHFATIGAISWSVLVRFERGMAGGFGRDRVWLVGDSAHVTGPVGVQSMNVGFREARDLVDAMLPVLEGGGSLDGLARYADARRREWGTLLAGEALKATPGADPWITERKARVLPCVPGSGADLNALLRQVGLSGG
jgi:2-polyprenyl-6-methoxyphenol hydroxylase-like FAD-dependent oxidoreductase